ncbi:hypothetical protein PR202_ga22515 [Eleusine coracana subsp. coracana]|uniref:BTB domain-containing protein n=1 Tax=Eleusine coracana subsp. coracana TaxID=191504 RepID=A0AAV5D3A2_ELECO|nr:hypothetical protein PR202_ga22515 [Eleusine coracana subsp. coracana]
MRLHCKHDSGDTPASARASYQAPSASEATAGVSEDGVKAQFIFSLLDNVGKPVSCYTSTSEMIMFTSKSPALGVNQFIQRKNLESFYLKDDSFSIRCDVTVVKKIRADATSLDSVTIPPSDLHLHLRDLLESKNGGDVTFEVGGGQLLDAHRYMLAARSSVFKAELFGPMKGDTASRIRIDDMEARVFQSMLHFIYTDSLPEVEDSDKIVMAQHLLVAADRYNLVRLKLICEDVLSSNIDKSIAASTLVLAEQHGCLGLKKACFKFLKAPGNLTPVMATDGFLHLTRSCPTLLQELLANIAS